MLHILFDCWSHYSFIHSLVLQMCMRSLFAHSGLCSVFGVLPFFFTSFSDVGSLFQYSLKFPENQNKRISVFSIYLGKIPDERETFHICIFMMCVCVYVSAYITSAIWKFEMCGWERMLFFFFSVSEAGAHTLVLIVLVQRHSDRSLTRTP